MSTEHPFTDTELAQQTANQTDVAWLEWVAEAPARADQFVAAVPDMPANPWTAEGLQVVEQYVLGAFENQDATLAIENRALAEKVWCYLGELQVRTAEAHWRNVPECGELAGLPFGPVTDDGYSAVYHTPITLLTALFSRAKAPGFTTFWGLIYDRHLTDFKKWVAAGRPPRADWVKQQEDEWLRL